MNINRRLVCSLVMTLLGGLSFIALPAAAQDPLPSWNDTGPKKAIIAFVARVTKPGTPDFVPVNQRIATFDNDGTLWAEQPLYFQFEFAIDRIKLLSAGHPEWKTEEPFASLLEGDIPRALARGEQDVIDAITATHAGMTTEAFERIAREWIQDLHRLGRRGRVHPRVRRGGLRHSSRSGRGKLGSPEVPDARRCARTAQDASGRFRQRQGRQGRWNPEIHRAPTHCSVRKLGRRPADAGVDSRRQRS